MSKRDDIQEALFKRLQEQVQGLKSSSRFYVDFGKLSQAQQPALSVVAVSTTAQRQPAMPAKWIQHAMIIFFVRTPSEVNATPETVLFDLIEQTETALQRQKEETAMADDFGTTLGGLVWFCHILDVHIHHGLGEGQAAASLTVEMLVYPPS